MKTLVKRAFQFLKSKGMQTRKHRHFKKRTLRKSKETSFHHVKSVIHKHSLERELLKHILM